MVETTISRGCPRMCSVPMPTWLTCSRLLPNLVCFNTANAFEKTLQDFIDQGVKGIIIDVRNNVGGVDVWIPQIVSHFFQQPDFYEYVSFYDYEKNSFQLDESDTLTIQPSDPYFAGPVVVLIDNKSISTAEGIPMAIQRLPQGYVAGIYGSNGTFAVGDIAGDLYRLPEGLAFNFLAGRSLDENMEIQIDGDADGKGGVVPDIRVPLTEQSVYDLYVEGQDIVLQAAIENILE